MDHPTLTLTCPICTLTKILSADGLSVLPADDKDADGRLLCPNGHGPMQPVGERHVVAAEQAFAEANQAVQADAGKTNGSGGAPPALLTTADAYAALQEIDRARVDVERAKARWERAKAAASDARKHFDAEMTTFLSVCRRCAQIPELPLFSAEAEAAAAAGDADPELVALRDELAAAGVVVPLDVLAVWTPEQLAETRTWLRESGALEGLPDHLAPFAAEPEDAEPESSPTDPEPRDVQPA